MEVALPLPVEGLFHYLVPATLHDLAVPGVRVRVPFGPRRLVAFVIRAADGPPPLAVGDLRPIDAVLDPEPVLTDEVRDLCRWAADYYFAAWGELLACSVPGGSPGRGRRSWPRRLVRIVPPDRDPEGWQRAVGRSGRRRELVARLHTSPEGLGSDDLPRDAARLAGPLVAAGLAAWVDPRPVRASGSDFREPAFRRTAAQDAAVDALREGLRRRTYAPFLLRGVTGSGKTEVYLAAAEETVASGGDVLYLVPEIGLTPLLAERFAARFGNTVAVLHSGMAAGERRREWARVRRGQARVVLGARSAIFAPLRRLRLIVVDEEQEGSFKQEERPRYQARDLALVRGRRCGAVVVLGSATPSMESFHHARAGKYRLLELPSRVADRPLATVGIVDMREEFQRRGTRTILSGELTDRLEEVVARGEQAVLLLNRRGYSAFLLCRDCGAIPSCPRCSVSLVHHRAAGRLRCHYCGHGERHPSTCPACGGGPLRHGSEGTERLEEALQDLLPGARLARLDRDTARRRGTAERLLAAFARGEQDILLGTQMVAKGHDFPRVTLVGVLAADGILGLPDFRAAERTFQLLTQVAGRAGRGTRPGHVVIQTYQPEHYAIRHAGSQDFEAFYADEIRFRRLLQYPPFTVLANVLVQRADPEAAWRQAQVLAREIALAGGEFLRVLGPVAAPLARLRGLHRVQILLKARARGRLAQGLRQGLETAASQGHGGRHVVIDMDPASLL